MQNIRTNNGYKVQVRESCYKKIQALKRKYANVGYALYWRDTFLEFQGWGRHVYSCKGKRV